MAVLSIPLICPFYTAVKPLQFQIYESKVVVYHLDKSEA